MKSVGNKEQERTKGREELQEAQSKTETERGPFVVLHLGVGGFFTR